MTTTQALNEDGIPYCAGCGPGVARHVHHSDGKTHWYIDSDAFLAVSLLGDGPDRIQPTQEEFDELVSDLREVREMSDEELDAAAAASGG